MSGSLSSTASRFRLILTASLILLAACNRTAPPDAANSPDSAKQPGTSTPATAAPAEPLRLTLPAGTPLQVRLDSTLSTKSARPGQTFDATLAAPLTIGGHRVAERGARARGVVLDSDPGGRVKGRASLSVRLTELTLSNGRPVALQTSPIARLAPATKKKDALKVGIGSGIGAAIGAGAGAGAGTGVVLGTRGAPAVIAAETPLSFKLAEPTEAVGPFPEP